MTTSRQVPCEPVHESEQPMWRQRIWDKQCAQSRDGKIKRCMLCFSKSSRCCSNRAISAASSLWSTPGNRIAPDLIQRVLEVSWSKFSTRATNMPVPIFAPVSYWGDSELNSNEDWTDPESKDMHATMTYKVYSLRRENGSICRKKLVYNYSFLQDWASHFLSFIRKYGEIRQLTLLCPLFLN